MDRPTQMPLTFPAKNESAKPFTPELNMSVITLENVTRVLADLVAFPSVNPMGRPYNQDTAVERPVVEYLERFFGRYDVEVQRQTCSPIHESLLIVAAGRDERPWTLFESHMDTVPADDWPDRAFRPIVKGDRLFGRGACDDKGCLTAMILALQDVLESGQKPPGPVALLAAGDEEYAQTGIKHFAAGGHPLGRGVFGEPTGLVPVLQHKGTIRWDITVHGRSAHTARPELGTNAIYGMIDVIQAIRQYEARLQAEQHHRRMTGPTVTVTVIHGGRTRNAVPDECTIYVDYRVLPGTDPSAEREKLIRHLEHLDLTVTHHSVQLVTPPLNTRDDDPFSRRVLDLCRRKTGQDFDFQGAPYGTDAAWVSERIPALVLGPGDIAHAHAVDEFVDLTEVARCAEIYRDIMVSEF
jgi:acetylornithine deacetylase